MRIFCNPRRTARQDHAKSLPPHDILLSASGDVGTGACLSNGVEDCTPKHKQNSLEQHAGADIVAVVALVGQHQPWLGYR